ncbi:hypothetical protein D3M61_07070 [Aliarcobacter butzleri]|uniref:hypothetical protein n=1 Tax=Aliarcobacter butzleri TaxID=28197 RepID=UPI00102E0CC8|nr:hypothetical protein [Aliarcobacter butzleri]RZV13635.1 hypothetical protein D3M61_07070 [Aliarcobacter butzleri]
MKFERPNSNVVPFGTNANENKRFAFGTNNYTNDINENLNDSFKLGWETVGINSKPPRQWFNGLAYAATYLTSYLFQTGIPEWNENQEYYINSITKGSDGKLYRSLVGTESSPNVNKNPLTEPNYWKNDNFELYEDSKFSIGFMDHLTSSLTKTSNSITLTFNADTKIYKYGKPYLFEAGESITFSTSSLSIGIGYYIILDLDTRTLFARSGTPNFSEDILVSWILLNSSSNIIWANDERHLCSRNVEWHKNHHLEVGASWLRGGNLIFIKDTVGAVNIEVNTPVLIADEELFYTIENNNTPTLPFQQKLQGSTNYNVYFLDNNQNYDFTNSGNGSCPFLYSGTSIKYNDAINGGLVNASNENFVCYWQLYTTDWENPVKMIIGRVSHSNISDAEKEVFEDYGLNMPEIIGVAKIIIQSDSSIIGNPPLRIRGVYYLRNETVQSSALTPTNHNNLAGRNEADQHPISSITGLEEALSNLGTLSIGAILNGYTIFDNCIVAFGGEFNRADYPKLWAYLQANPTLVKTEVQWQTEATANGGICGFYSSGNGTTTFRVPNLREATFKFSDRAVASFQGDAIRNIIGETSTYLNGYTSPTLSSGAFSSIVKANTPTGVNGGANWATSIQNFDASRVVPTATRTRVENIAVLPLIVAK